MAAKPDPRKLKDEAQEAVTKGKWKKALEAYEELAQLEPRDGTWPQKAGEMNRKLGKKAEAVAALGRAADTYSRSGFLVKAIAVCKLILELDPTHTGTQERLAALHAQRAQGPSAGPPTPGVRPAGAPAGVAASAARPVPVPSTPPPVAARSVPVPSTPPPVAARPAPVPSRPPPVAAPPPPAARPEVSVDLNARFEAPPAQELPPAIELSFAAPAAEPAPAPPLSPRKLAQAATLEELSLGQVVPGARRSQEIATVSEAAAYEIPLDDDLDAQIELITEEAAAAVSGGAEGDAGEAIELSLDDAEVAGDGGARPRATTTFAKTPLFSSLDEPRLLALIDRTRLLQLEPDAVLFRQGDPGDALYVIASGQVAVRARPAGAPEGTPETELARMGENAFFGEIALVAAQGRNATVVAVEPTDLLVIDRQVLLDLIGEAPEVLRVILRFLRDRLLERLIGTSPLFSPFTPEDRAALAAKFRFIEAEAGAELLTEGKKSPGLFVLLAGKARVMKGAAAVSELGQGDLFGEMSLLSHGPAVATIRAVGKCYLLELPRAAFSELIMTHPQVLEYMSGLADARQKELDAFARGQGAYGEGHVTIV